MLYMKICIFPILMSCFLTGCVTTPALPEQQRPQHWGQPIHQNHNFHQISNFDYRSEQPSTELIPLLK